MTLNYNLSNQSLSGVYIMLRFSKDSIKTLNIHTSIAGVLAIDTLADPTEVLENILKDAYSTRFVNVSGKHYNNYAVDCGDITAQELLAKRKFVVGTSNSGAGLGVQSCWTVIDGLVIVTTND